MRGLLAAVAIILVAAPAAAADSVGLVDPDTGAWHLRTPGGDEVTFFFGTPGDMPMMGDWDCDGTDTPGLYRQEDGFAYLRNSNSQGVADIQFIFGNPGDLPIAGDWDGDGCDTVSVYRPTTGEAFIINRLGNGQAGLGPASTSYFFGNPGDTPFVGDFDGDGVDTLGLYRESNGFVYFSNSHSLGPAERSFFYGDPGDRIVAGDWTGQGRDTVGIFRALG